MNGRVVVITGASAGIGAALAELLSGRGARVTLAARRAPELQEVARRVVAAGGAEPLVVVGDVTKRADVERIASATLERFGALDVWVNNAGRGITRLVSELTDEDLDEMMRVNVKSALYGMQTALRHFKSTGAGHIVNVSSMLGRVPYVPFRSAYSASKHALNALTANLRMELTAEFPKIFVSNVMPGPVATDFGNNALGGGPDSRSMPAAQTAEQVAEVIASVIESPRADVYTFPGHDAQAARYYQDVAAAEASLPTIRRP